jgi:pyruvate/2-oxoglutarate dehydrogenase complex dihydrolipoamide dehydrogenase (E3) component
VHAASRVPEINDLNLDVAGIEWEKRGVRVNEFLQSVSIPAVYAAGDAAASGGPPLAPVASYEGQIAAANLLRQDLKFRVKQEMTSTWYSSRPGCGDTFRLQSTCGRHGPHSGSSYSRERGR